MKRRFVAYLACLLISLVSLPAYAVPRERDGGWEPKRIIKFIKRLLSVSTTGDVLTPPKP